MSESSVPVNSMGSGENIATFSPLLKPQAMMSRLPTPEKKKLRTIIGSNPVKSELRKEKNRGI